MTLSEKTPVVKGKKIGVALVVIVVLLLADYMLKVREYNHLISANKIHEDTYFAWSKDTDIYFRNCTAQGYVREDTKENCEKFIEKSGESAGQLFVQNNQVERFFVAPWHTEMKYAYQDLATLIDDAYQSIGGWEMKYEGNGWGDNLRNNYNAKFRENALQYNQSLMEAKPFPGIFLDSAE